jgi:hypothetical protein
MSSHPIWAQKQWLVEAMRLAREGIRRRSDFVGAHRVLTAAAGMAGERDLA